MFSKISTILCLITLSSAWLSNSDLAKKINVLAGKIDEVKKIAKKIDKLP
jgi:hypothetical protein